MFAQLPELRDGLIMTRNEAAILGQKSVYPLLAITASQIKAANVEAGLSIDFRALSSAHALHLRSESGHTFGIEFVDHAGHIVHRFTDTGDSELDLLCEWVRLHQACTSEDDEVPVADRRDSFRDTSDSAVKKSDAGALLALLAACGEHEVPIRTRVYSAPFVHCVTILPRSLQPVEDWWFASDDEAGLHFNTAKLTRVCIAEQTGKHGRQLQLRCETDSGDPALVLECGDPEKQLVWSALLPSVA